MNLAVIPARGGSKRIPRKNLKPLGGRPLISHVIGLALASELFDRIIVSTDDDEIAQVAEAAGADVPFIRPAELADDHTGTMDVVRHAITWLGNAESRPDAVCCIYPTAPFIHHQDLVRGLEILESGRWRFVFAATPFAHPPERGFRMTERGGITMSFPQHFATRSQDLPETMHDAAQFYWGTPAAWIEDETIFGERSTIVRIPRWRVQDIDTPEDWQRAQQLWALMHRAPGDTA